MTGRAWLLDVLKALGCVLIVAHHLAFYGPMSDVMMQVSPGLIEWLYDRARLAVQMFLVCGGFLTAASMWHSAFVATLPAFGAALVGGFECRRAGLGNHSPLV
jgi:peptidoglycan/LPS O-acetylase OafA/YrhL